MSLYLWLSVMVKAGVVQCGDDGHIKDRRFSRELSKDVSICLLVTSLKKQTHWTQQLNEFLWNMFGRSPASYTMWLAYIHVSGHINRITNNSSPIVRKSCLGLDASYKSNFYSVNLIKSRQLCRTYQLLAIWLWMWCPSCAETGCVKRKTLAHLYWHLTRHNVSDWCTCSQVLLCQKKNVSVLFTFYNLRKHLPCNPIWEKPIPCASLCTGRPVTYHTALRKEEEWGGEEETLTAL